MSEGYLSNRYFGAGIDWKMRDSLMDTYSDPQWEYAKTMMTHQGGRGKITLSAIKLVKRMQDTFGLQVFPFVYSLPTYKGDGTPAFIMYGLNGKNFYFFDYIKDCLTKKYELKIEKYQGTTEAVHVIYHPKIISK